MADAGAPKDPIQTHVPPESKVPTEAGAGVTFAETKNTPETEVSTTDGKSTTETPTTSTTSSKPKKPAKSEVTVNTFKKKFSTIRTRAKSSHDIRFQNDLSDSQGSKSSPDTSSSKKDSKFLEALQRIGGGEDADGQSVAKGRSNYLQQVMGTLGANVLTAYLGFKDPKRKKRQYLIPKDKAAWLEWMVIVATKRINVEYLNAKELRKVIVRARPNLSPYKKPAGPIVDPYLPACSDWTVERVGEWIASIGYPNMKDTFMHNKISGRHLILVDCTALNKMGMTDLSEMRDIAGKIRELLDIPPPNQMRSIIRVSPFERFLRRRVYNGRSYDQLTFEKFCEMEGYPFELVTQNRNMTIPCTADVTITTPEQAEEDEDSEFDSDKDASLKNAPTVEFLVRNAQIRNKTIDQLLDDIIESVFLPPRARKYGKDIWGQLKRCIGDGCDDLHLYYPKHRLEFATGVANSLIDELYRTVAVLNDINMLENYIDENITDDDMDMFRSCAQTLLEEAMPLVSLVVLGDLDLEAIFKQEPEFQNFVDDVAKEAERETNELLPDAMSFVDEVISEALKKVPQLDISKMKPESQKSFVKMAENMQKHFSSTSRNTTRSEGSTSKRRSHWSTDHSGVQHPPASHSPKHGAAKHKDGKVRIKSIAPK